MPKKIFSYNKKFSLIHSGFLKEITLFFLKFGGKKNYKKNFRRDLHFHFFD